MSKKKHVTVDLYSQDGEHTYKGRCVGLLTDKEYNAIINNPELQRKLITVRTVPLADIAEKEAKAQDLRIAVITRGSLKDENTGDKKGIFITEPIELISQFTAPDDLTVVGTDGSYIMMKETEE